MKYIIFVKGNKKIESGIIDDLKMFEDMGKYNDELEKAGVLVDLNGLHPSSKGVRILFDDGKTIIKEGPFENPKELVEGYWIVDIKSKEEVIKWAKRIPFNSGEVEIRQIQDMSDLPSEVQKIIKRN